MDLKAINDNTNTGEWLIIYLPDGSKTDIKILIVGKGSYEYSSVIRKLQQKAITDNIDIDSKEWEKEFYEECIGACIKDWENVLEDGKALKCTDKNKRKLISEYPFIRNQIDKAIHNSDFFIKVSQGN